MISLVLAAAVSWPLQYNAGVAAYRSNDFSSAAITFEQTTASPDKAMQQRAYYNLGNTSYRLGEAELRKAELTKAEQLWQRAIKNYESALLLNPKDEDARFNLGFVKQRMELIKRLREEALRAKEAAEEAASRREYRRALDIMTSELQKNPVAKQLEDFTKRLKDISDIANSPQ